MKIIAIMIMLASLSACSGYGMSSGTSGKSAYPMESQAPRNDPSDIYFGG